MVFSFTRKKKSCCEKTSLAYSCEEDNFAVQNQNTITIIDYMFNYWKIKEEAKRKALIAFRGAFYTLESPPGVVGERKG